MRQTENYKLKLIDKDDEFSPNALNENAETLEAQLARVDAELDAKADQTAVDAEIARVGQTLRGQLVYVTGEYTGKGEIGADHPNRLEFPFKPLLVTVCHHNFSQYGQLVWLRGIEEASVGPNLTNYYTVYLTWEERAVQWYSPGTNPRNQLNDTDEKYYYFALGIQE